MSDFTFSVNMVGYDRATLRYVEELGFTFPQAVRQSSRLLAAELMKFTAPRSQAQGRAAVKRDIGRAMWLLDPDKIHNDVLATAVRDEEFDVVAAFIANLTKRHSDSTLMRFRLKHFSPDLHQSKRNSRGRVAKSQGVMVLERREYNRYVKATQKHVGSAKFGWAISGRELGVSIPAWIAGHSETQGDFHQDLNPQNPRVVMTNKSPGNTSITPAFIQRMVNRRTDAMNRDVRQILDGRASRYFS